SDLDTSAVTESSTLFCCCRRASLALALVLPLSPNSRSNNTRGLFCVGSGVPALFQEIVLVYGQANPVSQAPAVSPFSIASSSEASCVCLPVSCARIWSIEMPASSQVSLLGGVTSVRKRVVALACAPPWRSPLGRLLSPVRIRSCSRNGASVLSVGENSNAAPSPFGRYSFMIIPLGT